MLFFRFFLFVCGVAVLCVRLFVNVFVWVVVELLCAVAWFGFMCVFCVCVRAYG